MRDKKRSNYKKEIAAAIASAMMVTGILSGGVGTMVIGAAQDGAIEDGGSIATSDKAAEDAATQAEADAAAQAEADAAAQAAAAQAAAESEAAAQAAAQAQAEADAAAQAAAHAGTDGSGAAGNGSADGGSAAAGSAAAGSAASGDGIVIGGESAGQASGLIDEGQGDSIVIGDNTNGEQQTETQAQTETETESESEEAVEMKLLVYPADYPIIFLSDVTEVTNIGELTKMKDLKDITEEHLFEQMSEDENVLKALAAYARLNPDEPKLKKVYVPANEEVQFVINEDMAQQQWKDAHKGVKNLKPLEFEDFNKKKDELKVLQSDNKDKNKLDVTEDQDIYTFTMDEDYAILKIKKYISPEEQAAIDAAAADEAAKRAAELEASGETETETEGTIVTALDGVTQIDLKPEVASLLDDKTAEDYLKDIAKAGKEAKEGVDDVITIGDEPETLVDDADPANVPAGDGTDDVIIIGTDESGVDIMGGAVAGETQTEEITDAITEAATEEVTEAVTEAATETESETELDLSKLTFKSSNTKIAKVSKDGKITAVGTGTCTIYAYEGKELKSQVTITIQ